MSKRSLNLLLLMLVLSLPLLGELEPETVLENFADRFQRHALDIGQTSVQHSHWLREP